MEKIFQQYKKVFKFLPKEAKTKLQKSNLDRGGDGIYTKRRNRHDKVFVTFDSFVNNYNLNINLLIERYDKGFYILCSPKEYNDNFLLLCDLPIIVLYTTYQELNQYPLNESEIISKNENGELIGKFAIDIKNLDKHKKNGGNIFKGVNCVAQNEYDFATKTEQNKVLACLLYSMINMKNFYNYFPENKVNLVKDFITLFEKSDLFLDNQNLIKYTKGGVSKCPILYVELDFNDIVKGKIDGDIGRNNFNRTVTKINLHHIKRLISGELNHNHKNVFFGTAAGNTIDSAINQTGKTELEILVEMIKKYDLELLNQIEL